MATKPRTSLLVAMLLASIAAIIILALTWLADSALSLIVALPNGQCTSGTCQYQQDGSSIKLAIRIIGLILAGVSFWGIFETMRPRKR